MLSSKLTNRQFCIFLLTTICAFSIIAEAIDNNFVTDLTSMFLEDSEEFVGSPGRNLPEVQVPQFSTTFGANGNTGARTLANGKHASAVIDSVEFCENYNLFIQGQVGNAPYDTVVSIEYNLGDDMDDDDREHFYSQLIGERYVEKGRRNTN